MAISKQSIDDIRTKADIVTEICSRLELKKRGINYIGLCPFHAEKSPSFNVSITKQFFHCFGCGKSGDVIQFLMDHDGMQFHEAVHDLGERMGIKVEEDQDEQSIKEAQEKRKVSASLEDVCQSAASFYQREFLASSTAQAYALKRGLSMEIIETYGIGYAPNPSSRKALAGAFADYTDSTFLIEAGLVAQSPEQDMVRYDRFRGRLMFPIKNVRGKCIGFGGRVLGDEKPKYLNSPETTIFTKHKVLYGLHEARSAITAEKIAFIAEGYMDVVSMAQYGVGNAVAAMGTALTEDHLRVLLRFTDQICFVFDGDSPGRAAAERAVRVALPLLEPRHGFSFLTLPDEMDPDDYLRAHGKDAFLLAAKSAPTLSQFMLQTLMSQFGVDGKLVSAEAKTQYSVAARDLCHQIAQSNPLRDLLLQEIDTVVGRAPRLSVQERFRNAAADASSSGSFNSSSPFDPSNPQGGHAGGSTQALLPKKAWLPREEWLKTQKANGAGSSFSSSSRPAYLPSLRQTPAMEKKTIWERLVNAVVIAPQEAHAVAANITAFLDNDSVEETPLILILDQCGDMAFHPERHAPDQLQAAIDLLRNAQKVIIRQRMTDVSKELKKMRADGEISESEYVQKMMKVVA